MTLQELRERNRRQAREKNLSGGEVANPAVKAAAEIAAPPAQLVPPEKQYEEKQEKPLSDVQVQSASGPENVQAVPREMDEGMAQNPSPETGTETKEQRPILRESVSPSGQAEEIALRSVRESQQPNAPSQLRQAARRDLALSPASSRPASGTGVVHGAPPHSVEAELGVLGSMAKDPRAYIPIARQTVGAQHFYVPRNATLFNAFISMFENEGAGIDLITFTNYLRTVGQLESVGGPGFVTEVFDFVPGGQLIDYYLDIVKDKHARRELIRAGTDSVRAAYDEHEDLPEILAAHEQRMEAVRVTSEAGNMRLPDLADVSKYLGANLPPMPAELVKGILHQGSKIIVGGTSKGRKTMALLDLAISVASGHPWWGFETIQQPVCYINFEIPAPFLFYRVDCICKARKIDFPAGMFMAWNLRGHGEGIENLVQDLLAVLRHKRFGLDIVDPIYKALGDRDENKAGDVASMLNQLEKIAVKTSAAIAFGAHYSKGNQALKESIDRIGGSGVFARDPDSILTMTAHEEPEAFTVDATLRNHPPIEPFVVKWAWPLFYRDDGLDPEQLKPARTGGRPEKYSPNLLLELLSVIDGGRPKELCAKLDEAHGISRRNVYNMRDKLLAKGLLLVKDDLWFRGTKE